MAGLEYEVRDCILPRYYGIEVIEDIVKETITTYLLHNNSLDAVLLRPRFLDSIDIRTENGRVVAPSLDLFVLSDGTRMGYNDLRDIVERHLFGTNSVKVRAYPFPTESYMDAIGTETPSTAPTVVLYASEGFIAKYLSDKKPRENIDPLE